MLAKDLDQSAASGICELVPLEVSVRMFEDRIKLLLINSSGEKILTVVGLA